MRWRLVVGAAVGKLRSRDVQNPLPGPLRDHVHEAQQVLAGVPEAHAPARAAFKVGGGAAHVEGDHALVLVPGVDHEVHVFIRGANLKIGEQARPIPAQLQEGGLALFLCPVAVHQRVGPPLVDDAGGGELLRLRIFDVPQAQEQMLLLSRFQVHVELHRAHRGPALGHGPGADAF